MNPFELVDGPMHSEEDPLTDEIVALIRNDRIAEEMERNFSEMIEGIQHEKCEGVELSIKVVVHLGKMTRNELVEEMLKGDTSMFTEQQIGQAVDAATMQGSIDKSPSFNFRDLELRPADAQSLLVNLRPHLKKADSKAVAQSLRELADEIEGGAAV